MSYDNPRINLNDTGMSALVKMSSGNPGALTVLCSVLKDGKTIDPYCEPFLTILSLDSLDIYGSDIWLLYKDLAEQDLSRMLAILRAHQYGLLPEIELKSMLRGQKSPQRLDEVIEQVLVRLPNFKLSGHTSQTDTLAASKVKVV